MNEKPSKTSVSVTLDTYVFEALKEKAKHEDRAVSNMVNVILKKALALDVDE